MRLEDGQPVVIEQPWGGLGDNLQFSTLPEMLAAQGHSVFISARNAVRNPEIHELVWGRNPHVSGVSSGAATAGACRAQVFDGGLPRFTNYIRRIEVAHGLAPAHDYPRIYYQPTARPELADTILVDIGSTSVAAPMEKLTAYMRFVFQHFFYDPRSACQVLFQRAVAAKNSVRLTDLAPLTVRDIFDYCDALYSCKALVTVHSGAHSLAVAVRQERANPVIHCFSTPEQFNWRNYIFPRVEYFVL